MQQWIALGALALFIAFSPQAASGGRNGVFYCLEVVIPSLLPFLVFTGMLRSTGGGRLAELFGKLFRLPRGQTGFLLAAFAAGYPVGADFLSGQVRQKQLSVPDARRMLRFCGNPSPGFLFGMLSHYFPNRKYLFFLWGIQCFSAWFVSAWYPPEKGTFSPPGKNPPCSLSQLLSGSLLSMGKICLWVIVFSAVTEILSPLLPKAPLFRAVCTGLVELTSGIRTLEQIEDIRVRFLTCQFLISFGGICILLQTLSVLHPLPIGVYLQGKLLQMAIGFLCALGSILGHWEVFPILLAIGLWKMGIFRKRGSILRHYRV